MIMTHVDLIEKLLRYNEAIQLKLFYRVLTVKSDTTLQRRRKIRRKAGSVGPKATSGVKILQPLGH